MKAFEFLKKVLRKIEIKTAMLRKRILYTLIDTPVQVRVFGEKNNKKTILIFDEVKRKPLAELEIEMHHLALNKNEATVYYVRDYKIYK